MDAVLQRSLEKVLKRYPDLVRNKPSKTKGEAMSKDHLGPSRINRRETEAGLMNTGMFALLKKTYRYTPKEKVHKELTFLLECWRTHKIIIRYQIQIHQWCRLFKPDFTIRYAQHLGDHIIFLNSKVAKE